MTSLPDHLAQIRAALESAPPGSPLIAALRADPPDAGAVLRALGGDLDGPTGDVWGVLTQLLGVAIADRWRLQVPGRPEIAAGAPLPPIAPIPAGGVLRMTIADGGRWDAPGGVGAVGVQAFELELDLDGQRITLRAVGLALDVRDPSGILSMLGRDRIGIGGDLGAVVDGSGFRFTGGSRHDVELAATGAGLGDSPRFGLSWDPGDARLALTASFSGSAVGMTALVEKVGVRFSLAAGAPAITFKPPEAVGLAMDASSGISGGGFLGIRDGTFAGLLNLDVGPVEVTAFGLLTPDPFSLIIVLAAEFDPGVQLSFGFMLGGVGGIVGIGHAIDSDALGDLVQQGTVDQLLFPKDPVKNAPAILGALGRVFPRAPGSAVFGPLFRVTWGPVVPFITADLGVIAQLPDPRFATIGRLRIALPHPDLAIVELGASLEGHLEPARGLLEVNVVLTNSRINGLPTSGGLLLRVETSGDGEFVVSAGGFHPRYTPPAGVPIPKPIEVKLVDVPLLALTLRGFVAITSATIQFGGSLELVAGTDELGLTGHVGFAALLHWSPSFGFSAELEGRLAFMFLGSAVASLELAATLEGPSPCWHIAGSASIKVLFARVRFGIDESWGHQSERALPAPDVVDVVRRGLERPEAWAPRMPAGAAGILRLRVAGVGETATPRVHPLGSLVVHQELAPLNTTITRFGSVPLDPPKRLEITAGHGGRLHSQPTRDYFAAGQFFTLNDDQVLTAPAFDDFDSGVVVQSAGVTPAPSARTVTMMYEDRTIGGDVDPGSRFVLFEDAWVQIATAGGAVGRSEVHAERTRYQATNPLEAAFEHDDRPVAIDTRTRAAVALPGVDGARSHAEAAHALAVAVAADPGLAGTIALASAWELRP